jgi:hypothetical protein
VSSSPSSTQEMHNHSSTIVQPLWNQCNVLCDYDALSDGNSSVGDSGDAQIDVREAVGGAGTCLPVRFGRPCKECK